MLAQNTIRPNNEKGSFFQVTRALCIAIRCTERHRCLICLITWIKLNLFVNDCLWTKYEPFHFITIVRWWWCWLVVASSSVFQGKELSSLPLFVYFLQSLWTFGSFMFIRLLSLLQKNQIIRRLRNFTGRISDNDHHPKMTKCKPFEMELYLWTFISNQKMKNTFL